MLVDLISSAFISIPGSGSGSYTAMNCLSGAHLNLLSLVSVSFSSMSQLAVTRAVIQQWSDKVVKGRTKNDFIADRRLTEDIP